MKPPTSESFWVSPRVLAGKYPGAKTQSAAEAKIAALIGAGVRTFIDLTTEGELLPYAQLLPHDVKHYRLPVVDVTAPEHHQVQQALDLIDRASDDGVVYVHCWGGCGRTGVIVGCYLVEQGDSPEDALARVHDLTRALHSKPCPETPAQLAVVRGWRPAWYDNGTGKGGTGVWATQFGGGQHRFWFIPAERLTRIELYDRTAGILLRELGKDVMLSALWLYPDRAWSTEIPEIQCFMLHLVSRRATLGPNRQASEEPPVDIEYDRLSTTVVRELGDPKKLHQSSLPATSSS